MCTLISTALDFHALHSLQLVMIYLHNQLINSHSSHCIVSSKKEESEVAFLFYAQDLGQCWALVKNSVRVADYMTKWMPLSIWCTLDSPEYFPAPFIFWDSPSLLLDFVVNLSCFFLTSTLPFLSYFMAFSPLCIYFVIFLIVKIFI